MPTDNTWPHLAPMPSTRCGCCGLRVEQYRIIRCSMFGAQVCDNCTEPVDETQYADEQLTAMMREMEDRPTCQQCTRGICECAIVDMMRVPAELLREPEDKYRAASLALDELMAPLKRRIRRKRSETNQHDR